MIDLITTSEPTTAAGRGRGGTCRLAQCARGGFTLIELITVTAIIVVLLGITLPSMSKLLKGNSQQQGVNLLTAYVSSARATALGSKNPVAVIFYQDTEDTNQTAIVLARQTLYVGGIHYFDGIPGRPRQFMARGVKIATLNDVGQVVTEGTSTVPARAIIFNENGQLVFWNNLSVPTYQAGVTYAAGQVVSNAGKIYTCQTDKIMGISPPNAASWGETKWNFGGTAGSASTAGLLVYDDRGLQAAVDSNKVTNDATRSSWLQKNGDLVIINAYTGNVIRWSK